jgi:endonuclease IV
MDMVIGMGSGVIPPSSCSCQLHNTTQFNDHEDCRRKQQEIEQKLEETQILLRDMQEGMSKMQEQIDMLMALVRRLENLSNIIYFFTSAHTHTLTSC